MIGDYYLSHRMVPECVKETIRQSFMKAAGEEALYPQRIIRSGDATIVFWKDGSKTVVKRADDEPDNSYTAFCAAVCKKLYGSNSTVKRIIKQKTEHQKKKE